MKEKEDFLWEDDDWDSWYAYCPLYYPSTEEELENPNKYDEIESFDEKEYKLESVGRGRAFRRKMFFKKEKYKKNQEHKMHKYCDNQKFIHKHYYEIISPAFVGIDTHLYSIRVLSRNTDRMYVMVENYVNDSKSVISLVYKNSKWNLLREIYDNGNKPVYYKRFYPNRKGFKRIANKKVRHYHVYDEDGEDVSYPKKSRAHRKVFDTYDVCDY